VKTKKKQLAMNFRTKKRKKRNKDIIEYSVNTANKSKKKEKCDPLQKGSAIGTETPTRGIIS